MDGRGANRQTTNNILLLIVVAFLIIVAVLFATRPQVEIQYSSDRQEQTQAAANTQIDNDKLFGVKPEGWTAIFTGVLALFTVILTVVSFVQIRFLIKADYIAHIAADAALKSANAAKDAVELSELTLVGIEAPILFAYARRRIIQIPNMRTILNDGAEYYFKNFGRSPAIVREVYIRCVTSAHPPPPAPFPPLPSSWFYDEVIESGGTGQPRQFTSRDIVVTAEETAGSPATALWVVGQVRYVDVYGNQYLSGFRLCWNSRLKEFQAMGGSAHNYRRKLTEEETRVAEKRGVF
jgi:hypothetical protein